MSSQRSSRFSSPDAEERRRATSELADTQSESVTELVRKALADEDWRVRKEAVEVALALAPSPTMLEGLVNALMPSDNVGLRNAAVEALGGYGQAAVNALSRALPALDQDGRKLAVEALGRGGHPAALPVLATLLEDPDANVRAATAEAITAIGLTGIAEATPLLERCVESPEPLVALAALEGLNALGVTLPWSTIERCLAVPSLRRVALLAAGRSGDPRAVPVLLDALDSARGSALGEIVCAVRELVRDSAALEHLRERGAEVPERARRRVLELVANEDERDAVRRAALVLVSALGLEDAAAYAVEALVDDRFLADAHEALELLGERAVPALVGAIGHADSPARANCLRLLSRLESIESPRAVIEAARRALDDESPEIQREALAVLSRFGDESCLLALGRLLGQDVPQTVSKAAEAALFKLSSRHPSAARALVARAKPGGPETHAVCAILAALGPSSPEALEADLSFLSGALSDPSGVVRRAAVEALAAVGGARAVDAVAFALADEERDVQLVAITALGRIRAADGSAPGVQHLVDLVQRSSDAELVSAAIRALGDTSDPQALNVLRPLTRAAQPLVAVSAVEAVAELAGHRRMEALLEGLAHPDAEVVKATMLALSDTPDARVVAHLGACLDHEAWDVRRLAADLLGRVPGDAALALLRARLSGEDSPPVQSAIARALERVAGIRRSLPPGSMRPR